MSTATERVMRTEIMITQEKTPRPVLAGMIGLRARRDCPSISLTSFVG